MSAIMNLTKRPGRLGAAIGLSVIMIAATFFLNVSPARVSAQQDAMPQHADYGRYTFADLAEKVIPSVVTVYVKRDITKALGNRERQQMDRLREFFGDDLRRMFPGMPEGGLDSPDRKPLFQTTSGSGVVLSEDGFIITNWHVVGELSDGNELTVVFSDDTELSGDDVELVDSNELADLAVIKVNRDGLKPIQLGDSDSLRIGERVAAVGSPLDLRLTVTQGIICAKGRQVDTGVSGLGDMIQTDAVINPGSSGGALVNMEGELIGLNRLITSNTGRWQGYGFAIPVSDVKRFAQEVMETGHARYGFIGVEYRRIWPNLIEAMGLDENQNGMLVEAVTEDSPAEKAGIKCGDIIVEVDDRPIKESNDLRGVVARQRIGAKVAVKVLRPEKNGDINERTFTLKIQERDEKLMRDIRNRRQHKYQAPQEKAEDATVLGMLLEPYSEDGVQGLEVVDMDPKSAAARGGLEPGDVLIRMNGVELKSFKDLKKAIGDQPSDKAHWVHFLRDGRTAITTIEADQEK